jgi:hypothetical protein
VTLVLSGTLPEHHGPITVMPTENGTTIEDLLVRNEVPAPNRVEGIDSPDAKP